MSKIRKIVSCFKKHKYVDNDGLAARYYYMLYLADWYHSLHFGAQMTDTRWVLNDNGPLSRHALEEVILEVMVGGSYSGFLQEWWSSLQDKRFILNSDEISSINHVISNTKSINLFDLITVVKSTYPVLSSDEKEGLDLERQSKEYKDLGLHLDVA